MKSWLLILICCVLPVGALQGATTVRGGFVTNEIWTTAASPYVLTGDVIVPDGSYLEIQGGTEIVAGNDIDGTFGGYIPFSVEFIVRGELRCATDDNTNRIVFRGSRTMPGAWRGIIVEATNSIVAFENIEVRHAQRGIQVDSGRSPARFNVTVTNAIITQCEAGIVVRTGQNVALERVKVFGCDTGIWSYGGSYFWLYNSLIYDNNHHGLSIGSATIINCTIHGNPGAGIRVADRVHVANSLVTSNGSHGLEPITGLHTPYISLSDSIIWGNRLGAFPTAYQPIHLGSDPHYIDTVGPDGVSATGDENFSVSATSPAIDAGENGLVARHIDLAGMPRYVDDPSTPDRGDGSAPVIDIGAYEFQPTVRFIMLQPSAGGTMLSFNTIPDALYAIEASEDLQRWETLPDTVNGTGTIVTLHVTENLPKRFFRIRIL